MKKVHCTTCGFEDEFEPDEFGLTYYQSEGECPECGGEMVYEDGIPTRVVIELQFRERNGLDNDSAGKRNLIPGVIN